MIRLIYPFLDGVSDQIQIGYTSESPGDIRMMPLSLRHGGSLGVSDFLLFAQLVAPSLEHLLVQSRRGVIAGGDALD